MEAHKNLKLVKLRKRTKSKIATFLYSRKIGIDWILNSVLPLRLSELPTLSTLTSLVGKICDQSVLLKPVIKMSHLEKPLKISKQLRLKAQEFLSSRKNPENLIDIVRHFESGADLSSCLLTLELIFTNLLKDKSMYIEVVPLKPIEKNEVNQFKDWLRRIYESCFNRILNCMENDSHKIQIQGKIY